MANFITNYSWAPADRKKYYLKKSILNITESTFKFHSLLLPTWFGISLLWVYYNKFDIMAIQNIAVKLCGILQSESDEGMYETMNMNGYSFLFLKAYLLL